MRTYFRNRESSLVVISGDNATLLVLSQGVLNPANTAKSPYQRGALAGSGG